MHKSISIYLIWYCLYCVSAQAESSSLFDLSLEELQQIKISVASKSPQEFVNTARSVYVITAEDIKRSGHTSVPEVLRLAPGVHVAQITAHRWAISIRGFQQEFAGKLLVLLDGRTIYTPTFSGVHWDANDISVAAIERIEIVRGPASVSWGANAMNGVINIITKHPEEYTGASAQVLVGNQDKLILDTFYGGELGDWNWRAYARLTDRAERERDSYESSHLSSTSINDHWNNTRVGFRIDRHKRRNLWTISADFYEGDINDLGDSLVILDPARTEDRYIEGNMSGYSWSAHWEHERNGGDIFQLQVYCDNNEREDVNVKEKREVCDFSALYDQALNHHHLTYGFNIRDYENLNPPSLAVTFSPENQTAQVANFFVRDEWEFVENWSINVGASIEDVEDSDLAVQLGYGISRKMRDSLIWASTEEAVRSTNRLERDVLANMQPIPESAYFDGQPEGMVQLTGQDSVVEEELRAYELGYRNFYFDGFYWDITAYHFIYDNLIFFESEDNFGEPFINNNGQFIIPVNIHNSGEGTVSGAEISFAWEANKHWQLKGAYTHTKMKLEGDDRAEKIAGETPENQFHLRSLYNFNQSWNFDTAIYYVENLPGFGSEFESYVRVDLRTSWKIHKDFELTLVGQNLMDKSHNEHNEKGFSTFAEVPRSFYIQLGMVF